MKSHILKKGCKSSIIKKVTLVTISGIISMSFSGCYFFPDEEEVLAPPLIQTPQITFNTIDVKKGNIEKKISATGTITSSHLENLYFKFKSGYLKSINAVLGDKINVGDIIAELDTDSLSSQMKQQEITVRVNELRYESKKINQTTNSFDIEEARLNLESSKLKLEDLRNEYEKAKLYSSISGVVVYIDSVNLGDSVTINKTLVTIADPQRLLLQYKGDDSSNFIVGTEVTVKYKNNIYKAEVVSSPYTLPIDANKNLRNSAYFKIEGIPSEAQIGESAEVILILDKKENVIIVPRSMINSYGGRNYVQVLENGMKYERDVELGIQTPTEVEIKKGLKEGDKLIQR
jgi:membrane fusion protein, macrolide-specific efflux system